jgi:SRSO17 transposase
MPLHIPASLDGLLSLFADCFTKPTLQTFRALVIGQISQPGPRTVTGMLVGARLSRVWDHCRAHRFFSRARWSPDALGLRLAETIVERLVPVGGAVVIAIDDTLFARLGRKVHGTFWHYDATANAKAHTYAWGNSWVVAGVVVPVPFCERSICLPILFRLWRPRRSHIPKNAPDPDRPSKPELARQIVDLLADRLSGRTVHVVADSAYGSRAWRGVGERISVTFRLRKDAALFEPAPPRSGGRGRPATRGARCAGISQIAHDPETMWSATEVTRYATTKEVSVHDRHCVWPRALLATPVRLIVVADPSRTAGHEFALLTTDQHTAPAALIERYADRWSIEVAFEDAKQLAGVGDARNRVRTAVERTVPFQFLCMTLTFVWYAMSGHHPEVVAEHRARAPWYRTKTSPSFADMLAKLRRVIIAAQYRPGRGQDPTTAEISEVQHAWAAAGV